VSTTVDWSRLEAAYLSGIHHPARRPDTFSIVLGAQVAQRLGPAEHVQVRTGWAATQQALHATRRREPARTVLELRRAQRLRDDAAGSPEAWLLIESTLGAVEAYVKLTAGDWPAADAALERVLHTDAELRARGYVVLEMHRVQAAHNKARIAVRRGATTAAVGLLAGVIGYLRGVHPWPLEDGRADPRALTAQPAGLVSAMHAQLAGEIGLIVARNDAMAPTVLASLDRTLGAADPRSLRIADRLRRLLAAGLAGDVVAFAAEAEALLERGPQGGGVLWHLTALDVLGLILDGDHSDLGAASLAQAIERYSGARSSAPLSVRTAHRITREHVPSP